MNFNNKSRNHSETVVVFSCYGIDKSLSFPFFLGSVSQQPVFPGLRSPALKQKMAQKESETRQACTGWGNPNVDVPPDVDGPLSSVFFHASMRLRNLRMQHSLVKKILGIDIQNNPESKTNVSLDRWQRTHMFFSGLPSAKDAPKRTSAKSKAKPEKPAPSEVPPQKRPAHRSSRTSYPPTPRYQRGWRENRRIQTQGSKLPPS